MRGTNILHFNKTTVIEAIRYYLENEVLRESNFKVINVVENKVTTSFEITIEQEEEE